MDEQQKLSADDIMTALRINSGFYEREMVDAAIERKDEIIPRLIEVLRKLLDDPMPLDRMSDARLILLQRTGILIGQRRLWGRRLVLAGDHRSPKRAGILQNHCCGPVQFFALVAPLRGSLRALTCTMAVKRASSRGTLPTGKPA